MRNQTALQTVENMVYLKRLDYPHIASAVWKSSAVSPGLTKILPTPCTFVFVIKMDHTQHITDWCVSLFLETPCIICNYATVLFMNDVLTFLGYNNVI